MAAVKLAKNECFSHCISHQQYGFVSDASALQTEDVYEGISSPPCPSVTRNGLLKTQKHANVSTVTGNLTRTRPLHSCCCWMVEGNGV